MTMDLSWISILLLMVVVLLISYVVYMSWTHNTFKKMGIPGPTPWPVVGNFWTQGKEGMFDFQKKMYAKYKNEKVWGYFDARQPILCINDLDMIKDIMVKNFNSFVNRRRFVSEEPVDHALTMLVDEHWKNVRTTMSPTFSSGKLKGMSKHVERTCKTLVENLQSKQESNEEVELKEVMSCFAMDVIANTGFGVEINCLKDPKNPFNESAKTIMYGPARFLLIAFFFPFFWPILQLLGVKLFEPQAIKYFQNFIDSTRETRKEEMNSSPHNRRDFLQLLIDAENDDGAENDNMTTEEAKALKTGTAKKSLSYNDIQGQAFIFIFAGYNTVSTVMSFTLYLMATNPECCRKTQEELDEKLGGAFPTYESVQSLTYLDMCLNESMRMYPPGFLIDRECSSDITIQGINFTKGTIVSFPVYAIHHDPKLWPEPEKFIPERFTAENKANRHPYAHLPFGQGPRNCIGMRLALLELKVGIAAILQKLTPVLCSKSDTELKLMTFQMEAQKGLWVKMEARK